jgi:hypothetical protein
VRKIMKDLTKNNSINLKVARVITLSILFLLEGCATSSPTLSLSLNKKIIDHHIMKNRKKRKIIRPEGYLGISIIWG